METVSYKAERAEEKKKNLISVIEADEYFGFSMADSVRRLSSKCCSAWRMGASGSRLSCTILQINKHNRC